VQHQITSAGGYLEYRAPQFHQEAQLSIAVLSRMAQDALLDDSSISIMRRNEMSTIRSMRGVIARRLGLLSDA
jgi:hypothetical protein